jgi:hypothetical protein
MRTKSGGERLLGRIRLLHRWNNASWLAKGKELEGIQIASDRLELMDILTALDRKDFTEGDPPQSRWGIGVNPSNNRAPGRRSRMSAKDLPLAGERSTSRRWRFPVRDIDIGESQDRTGR